MAYSYSDINTRKGNGCNNLVIYSLDGQGPTEVRLQKSSDFNTMFKAVRAVFSRAFDSYAGSMYKKESIINMNIPDERGNLSSLSLKIDLTDIEHVIGLPHSKLIATRISGNDLPVSSEKGFIDYLNYFIFSIQSTHKQSLSMADLNDEDKEQADLFLKQLKSFDTIISRDIIPNLSSQEYNSLEKMLNVLLNAQNKLLELTNKPLIGNVKELYTYSLYMLEIVNDLIIRLSRKMSMHKFEITGKDDDIKVSIASGFEEEFYADILKIFNNNLSGPNINNKQQGKIILGSLKNDDTLLELLRKYKATIAPSLTIREFEVLIKTKFSNIKSFIINQMIKSYDKTTLSYDKYSSEEKKDDSNRISNYIRKDSSSKISKNICDAVSNIPITNPRVLEAEALMAKGEKEECWDYLASLALENKADTDLYLSILSFMNKYQNEVNEALAENDDLSLYFDDAIYPYLDQHSDIVYKYITISNELNTFINNDKSVNQSHLGGLFAGDDPAILEGINYSSTTKRFIESRSLVNNRINQLRSYTFYDDVLADIFADDTSLIDNLSRKSQELIDKYGVAYIFNLMTDSSAMVDLFEYEYSIMGSGMPGNKQRLRELNLVLPRNSSEDNFEYLKRVWNKVSRITSFEYKYNVSGTPMTYAQILTMFRHANNISVSINTLFNYVCRANHLDRSITINDYVSYEDAVEQFSCLKMHLYESGLSDDREIYEPYLRTILWDKVMYKSGMLERLDESIFTSSILRKAVDYVIHNIGQDRSGTVIKQSSFNSNIHDIGLMMEIPTTSSKSILLYLKYERTTSEGYVIFKPIHILSDVLVGTNTYQAYLIDGTSVDVPITRSDGTMIDNPIVGYSSRPLTTHSGNIDIRALQKDNLITRQTNFPNRDALLGSDLIVSQGGSVVHQEQMLNLELLELQKTLIGYGIDITERSISNGGVSI